MTLFAFVVYTMALSGVRMSVIAERLGITRCYLSTIVAGRRPLTLAVKLRASTEFRAPLNLLDHRISARDVQRYIRQEVRNRRASRSSRKVVPESEH